MRTLRYTGRTHSEMEFRLVFLLVAGNRRGVFCRLPSCDTYEGEIVEMFTKPASKDQELKWAHIWYKKLARFHHRQDLRNWDFSAEQVIQFLQFKRDASAPAWKRMKILDGLGSV